MVPVHVFSSASSAPQLWMVPSDITTNCIRNPPILIFCPTYHQGSNLHRQREVWGEPDNLREDTHKYGGSLLAWTPFEPPLSSPATQAAAKAMGTTNSALRPPEVKVPEIPPVSVLELLLELKVRESTRRGRGFLMRYEYFSQTFLSRRLLISARRRVKGLKWLLKAWRTRVCSNCAVYLHGLYGVTKALPMSDSD